MPMKRGASPTILRANIAEGVRSFKRTGTFGNSRPASMRAALRQIAAAAYHKQRQSKGKG
jgi:hypothetical protein